ncbi:hypothetical protein B1748_06995 [Paenibacillus sp. MY03]|jgi:hypothetical protein|uniref:Uncharacterized protein n=1 Tax=Paenibacillus agaridevorans TaxID=171404 RepID=A0A2R5F192_9BACL|nr:MULTISPECIES: hypothetical protein [Paenibacillus]OUS77539.1 hypothetical protein B1748_06995 [Paenibacillus sp. MY03]GBG12205.1 hypothetical protein PAT3040_07071 [Paenibacillus agaridevorans]
MSVIEIQASFGNASEAKEAARKLQALRAAEIGGYSEGGMVTASVDEAVADRAIHLIRQIGGKIDSDISMI